ncbi:GNAT family N-acetyltransferase [Akkermansiaceae bacterium]|nr:GNAT family N-acetyltransferase [Akkermansiaceae bacterium]
MISLKYQISKLGAEDYSRWSNFVEREQLPYSYSLLWKRVLADLNDIEECYWIVSDPLQERAVAILPAYMIDGPLGKVVNSLPYTQSVGGLVVDKALSPLEESQLLSELRLTLADFCEVNRISFWSEVYIDNVGPHLFPDVRIEERRRPFELLNLAVSNIKNKRRKRSIKQGEKACFQLFKANSMDEAFKCHQVYADAMLSIEVGHHSWVIFEEMINDHEDNCVEFYGAKLDGLIVGTVILMIFNGRVSYYASGCSPTGKKHQVISWLCNELILMMAKKGMKIWDWMPSPNKTVSEYKASWGGEMSEHIVRTYCFKDPKKLNADSDLLKGYEQFYVHPFDLV